MDGNWDFQFDPSGIAEYTHLGGWRPIRMPAPWQAEFDDLRGVSGVGWYRRRFTIDELIYPEDQAAILHFGAVDYHATVWVNGNLLGEHEGGYLPFEFDVAAELRVGANLLVVRVVDPTDDRKQFPDWPFSEIPHGKQSWYGPIGGVWQGVWLEMRPKLHIANVKLTPDPATGRIAIQTRLSGVLPANGRLSAIAYAPDGEPVGSVVLDPGGNGAVMVGQAPLDWSPDSPNLYAVETTLTIAGATRHVTRQPCGFRTVEARNGRIYLNGAPIYLRGALDQAYYPETIYSPPSVAFLEDQVRKAKALGLNCLRTHIKIEDPRYYEVADRLGLLIWTEIPNWALLSDAADRRIKETFCGMVERDWNHPSIIAWSLVNESWGLNLARNPEHRHWLAAFYQDAKEIDPTRLIVDNSACCDNFHVASDLEDFHAYFAIPDHAAQWDAWVEHFADRNNGWTWAQDFRLMRRPDLPLIVSEFGNWGLPDPDSLPEKGKEPWWFESGHERDNGIVYPHGMHQRFMDSGLAEVFGTLETFTQFAQEHMA
ncbi:MAG: hypothetical protein IPK16_02405 [Anaerolineales bacterium]|nr:hypothetical protein [Anaerolineales bacterium]